MSATGRPTQSPGPIAIRTARFGRIDRSHLGPIGFGVVGPKRARFREIQRTTRLHWDRASAGVACTIGDRKYGHRMTISRRSHRGTFGRWFIVPSRDGEQAASLEERLKNPV